MDLWCRQPYSFLTQALEEGFRNFSWHIGIAMAKRLDPISRVRAGALGFGERTRLMLIDYPGATEYNLFSNYSEPIAVYPTWAVDDDPQVLRDLCKKPVGYNRRFTDDESVRPEHRPVFGQKHRVVVHRIRAASEFGGELNFIMTLVRNLQAEFEDVELFVSGLTSFDHLFNWDLAAADFRPSCMNDNKIFPKVTLPSGRVLHSEGQVFDSRFADWFDLIGITQVELLESLLDDRMEFPRFDLRSARWAQSNFMNVRPFVRGRMKKFPSDYEADPNFVEASSADFVLPATRRRVMRNIGLKPSELDRFMCDGCILHNTCSLYRAGSVCTVKGSEAVALADAFGTRSASRIIDGLDSLLKKQAERLEDAMAAEDPAEPNPDITRQLNAVFSNGVKLAKLLDPTLSGPGVQVNIGVGAGGSASIVAQQDPRQITSRIVAELEASGIPREKITSEMLAGYFKSMGVNTDEPERKAVGAVKAQAGVRVPREFVDDGYSPEEALIPKPLLDPVVIEGEVK
jgi:hypothetical protein